MEISHHTAAIRSPEPTGLGAPVRPRRLGLLVGCVLPSLVSLLGAGAVPGVQAAQRKSASPLPVQVLQFQNPLPPSPLPPQQPVPPDVQRADYSLDRDSIRRVIYVHIKQVRHCYQLALMKQPALQGRVVLQFDITPFGQVEELGVREATLQSPALLECVSESMRGWEFPRAPFSSGNVRIIYPFVFRPKIPEPAVGIQVSDEELAQMGILKDPEPPSVEILF
ncbi:MAG: AgmX/PglI C-terminal domain-containing protein [Polyangia bacterium]